MKRKFDLLFEDVMKSFENTEKYSLFDKLHVIIPRFDSINKEQTEYVLRSNSVELVIDKESEEYGKDMWRIMLFAPEKDNEKAECILSDTFNEDIDVRELRTLIDLIIDGACKKLNEKSQAYKDLNDLYTKIS